MIELFTIEKIESEIETLYEVLDKTSDIEERECIQQAIQERNLKLV